MGENDLKENDLKTIFVSIVAYCDPELEHTIADALVKMSHKNRLIFGICIQDKPEKLEEVASIQNGSMTSCYDRDLVEFRIICIDYKKSQGCCWARNKVQQELFQDEEYFLQLDSHHRFVKDWDKLCVEYLNTCLEESETHNGRRKAILTSYPPHYDPCDDIYLEEERPNMNVATGFYSKGKLVFEPVPIDDYEELDKPQLTFALACGFLFTLGEWVREVPYMADLYFDGEEDTLIVRSWTHGWDFYYPHRIIVYHYYDRPNGVKHWDTHEDWTKLEERSMGIMYQILYHGQHLGTVRSLEEYEHFSGVNFKKRTLTGLAQEGKPDLTPFSETEEKPVEKHRSWLRQDGHNWFSKADNGGNIWREYNQGYEFAKFVEISNTHQQVILFDKDRALFIKLENDKYSCVNYQELDKGNGWMFIGDGEFTI